MPNEFRQTPTPIVRIEKMPPPHWTSFSALAISVITAIGLILQIYETKIFYKQSLAPLVFPYVTDSTHEQQIGIFLKNHGGGPGIVTIKRILFDGKRKSLRNIVVAALRRELIEEDAHTTPLARKPGETFAMENGRTVSLLSFPTSIVDTSNLSKRREFQQFIHQRINIEYEWCSIYGECFEHCTSIDCKMPQEWRTLATKPTSPYRRARGRLVSMAAQGRTLNWKISKEN